MLELLLASCQSFLDPSLCKSPNFKIPRSWDHVPNTHYQNCLHFKGDLVIPFNIKYIPFAAFRSSGFDGRLIFHDNLESIFSESFKGCFFTGDLVIPPKIKYITDSSFAENYFNGTLKLNEGLVSIGGKAFDLAGFIGTLEIPSTVTTISHNAFNENNFDTLVIHGDSLTIVYADSFAGTNFSRFEFLGSKEPDCTVVSLGSIPNIKEVYVTPEFGGKTLCGLPIIVMYPPPEATSEIIDIQQTTEKSNEPTMIEETSQTIKATQTPEASMTSGDSPTFEASQALNDTHAIDASQIFVVKQTLEVTKSIEIERSSDLETKKMTEPKESEKSERSHVASTIMNEKALNSKENDNELMSAQENVKVASVNKPGVGSIVGIVFGAIAFVAIVILVIVYLVYKKVMKESIEYSKDGQIEDATPDVLEKNDLCDNVVLDESNTNLDKISPSGTAITN